MPPFSLFILCSEYLSILTKQSIHPGLGIKTCRAAPKISHLLFADDTLLFGTATLGTAAEFAKILENYCKFSGEAINANKSNILFGPKVENRVKDEILHLLGFAEAKAVKYLGITLRPGKVRIRDYDDLLDKISCKIRSWGAWHLSLAGRVALINSTLTAIPSQALCNTPIPVSVTNKINSLLKNFLWNGARSGHTIHYAAWDEICTPKQFGGLGIRNLSIWRKVVMAKVAR